MQTSEQVAIKPEAVPESSLDTLSGNAGMAAVPGLYKVIRRNGKITAFDDNKIAIAMTKAFLAVEGGSAAASASDGAPPSGPGPAALPPQDCPGDGGGCPKRSAAR